jgi:hypothetical protein
VPNPFVTNLLPGHDPDEEVEAAHAVVPVYVQNNVANVVVTGVGESLDSIRICHAFV